MKTFFEKELKTKTDEELYQLLVEKYKVGDADIVFDLLEDCSYDEKQNVINYLRSKK